MESGVDKSVRTLSATSPFSDDGSENSSKRSWDDKTGLEDSKRRKVTNRDSPTKYGRQMKYSNTIVGNTESTACADVRLECGELWRKFNELGTEMIITKAGRRMFPVVRVRCSGLIPNDQYLIVIDIQPVDDMRYRYAYHRSTWLIAGKADPHPVKRYYMHPDCPFTGEQLINQVISFEKVKLTNNDLDQHGHVILNSMHKYQPVIKIISKPPKWDGVNFRDIEPIVAESPGFKFPETVFIAVTAYQNQLITKLKINSNPFAKGFRDSSRFFNSDNKPNKQTYPNCYCPSEPLRSCPHHHCNPSSMINNNNNHIQPTNNHPDKVRVDLSVAQQPYQSDAQLVTSQKEYRYPSTIVNSSMVADIGPPQSSGGATNTESAVGVEYQSYRFPVPPPTDWHVNGSTAPQFLPIHGYQAIGPPQPPGTAYLPPYIPTIQGVWTQNQSAYYSSMYNARHHMK